MPSPAKLQGFIFDIGQVLIDWRARRIWQHIIADDAELTAQMDFFRPFMYLGDAGVSYPMIIDVLSAIMPERAAQLQFWWQHWHTAFKGEIAGTVALVRELKALGYRLYILSNFSLETLKRLDIPSLKLFDDKIISAEVGLVKPQAQIFQLCIERFSLEEPQKFLFIDDLADNISAALAAGLQGYLFKKPEGLRLELQQRGVL